MLSLSHPAIAFAYETLSKSFFPRLIQSLWAMNIPTLNQRQRTKGTAHFTSVDLAEFV